MEQLLYWYSKNNSLMIQSLSVIIGLLLCFFIFRLFFVQSKPSANTDNLTENNSTNSVKKTYQISESISQQKNNSEQTFNIPASSSEAIEQIEKIQAENLKLKQQIADQNTISNNNATLSSTVAVDESEYKKQIEDLKNRLSDYEVIAEDIADLYQLREENQKLMMQIKNQKSSVLNENQDSAQVENTIVTDQEKNLIEQFEKIKGT